MVSDAPFDENGATRFRIYLDVLLANAAGIFHFLVIGAWFFRHFSTSASLQNVENFLVALERRN